MQREGALDAALSADDEQLFYHASVHFLKKRLLEKSNHTIKPQDKSQSCCNFATNEKLPPIELRRESLQEINYCEPESPLPMHRVLPFPKTSKETFMSRLKTRFRRMRHRLVGSETHQSPRKPRETSKYMFPRCERPCSAYFSTELVDISEESSQETGLGRRKSTLHLCDSNSFGNKPK